MATKNDIDALPLAGVVLCCTSLTQDVRTRIAETATQLGAVHKLDLTSDVTHLLVGDIHTPKYRYVAKERPDVKVLRPEFVDAVNDLWREAEDLTQERITCLEEEHKIPTFASLQICITGFEDLDFRSSIKRDVEARGGKFNPDLVKAVTHLVAARPEGAKYTHAKQWGIHVVGLKWLEDCMLRGMALDESFYLPELPREKQGIGAFRTVPMRPESAPAKRRREDETAPAEQGGRKKLRKSASMRLGGQSQDLWQNFSQQEVQVETSLVDAWQDTHADQSQTMRDSLAPRRSDAPEVVERTDTAEPKEFFAGYYVLIHGFDVLRTKQLRVAIEKDGATVVRNVEELKAASQNQHFKSRCLLMPHAQPTKLPDVPSGTLLVTEWWLERCLYFRKRLDPNEDALSQPLAEALVPSFTELRISITGFGSVDFRMTAETIRLMGAEYQEQLLPSTSILVCGSTEVKREKALYASKHRIPVVSTAWLWESLRSRDRVPLDEYKFELPAYDQNQLESVVSRSSPALSAHCPARDTGEQDKRAEEPVQPKRLSNARRRHATPSLMLKPVSASGPSEPAPKKPRTGPFVHEDDDVNDDDLSAVAVDINLAPEHLTISHSTTTGNAGLQPLREISPNTSQWQSRSDKSPSQRQASNKPRHDNPGTEQPSTEKASDISPQDDTTHGHEIPPKSPRKQSHEPSTAKENSDPLPAKKPISELTSDLASILNRRVASGENAASHVQIPEKRKNRPLGRNLSGTSVTHLAGRNSASPAMSALGEEGQEYSEADGFAPSKQPVVPPPGTQLGYGGDVEGPGRRTMSVKDSETFALKKEAMGAAAAAGGRKAARARTKT